MTVTLEKPITLEITRHFDVPPTRLFDAWLEKSCADWMGPPGVKGEVAILEPHAGGRYRIIMHRPDGSTLTVGGTYREVTRPSRIVMDWRWEHEEAHTVVSLIFRESAGGTDLTLRHEGFAATDRRDGHQAGWTGTLEKLTAFLQS